MSLLPGSAIESGGYDINNSLRLRSSASAYLSRTPASTTNRRTFTYSFWYKRGEMSTSVHFLWANNATTYQTSISLSSDSGPASNISITLGNGSVKYQTTTTAVFRDPSAWYHIVIAVDTTQATSSNRLKIYVNGEQQTAFSNVNYPPQNFDTWINSNSVTHYIGASYYNGSYTYTNGEGYLAEYNFIDGQALTPSSFGQTDPVTGVWQPKKYTGTYGTNGFYLKFSTTSLGTLLSTSSNISAPFGGVATNTLVSDGVYCTSNTSTGSAFTFLLNDFGSATQVTRYVITNLYFTGGVSTFSIQGSSDNSSWTTFATLSVTGSAQNFSGSLNGNFRYWRLAPTAFGTNGQANVDQFVLYQDGIGLDSSPNGNNWTPNNISVTSGTTYDAMTDSPTNTSATVANYAVLSPLDWASASGTLSAGNLNWASSTNVCGNKSTIGATSGKWYWEAIGSSVTSGTIGGRFGFTGSDTIAAEQDKFGMYWHPTSGIARVVNGTNTYVTSAYTYTNSDVLALALDLDSNISYWYKNGVLQYTFDFSSFSTIGSRVFHAYAWNASSGTPSWVYNFGQRPFAYTPRTNHLALNTYNLPDSTIKKGNTVMDATLYTGNGASPRSITNTASFKPDLVWVKSRSNAEWNILFDSVRGTGKSIYSNDTAAEVTNAANGYVSAFNSNGYSVTAGSSGSANVNANAYTYVAWQWQAGQGSTSNITVNQYGSTPSIASTVSVNTTAGFSVVTYTSQASGSGTVGHGLGVAPKMIIVKGLGNTNWSVYNASSGAGNYLLLNTTAANTASTTRWNNTSPTSNVFSIGSDFAGSFSYVAYCWAEIAGFSKFGSYTGNGSADGPFVYLGFRPKYIIIKPTNVIASWTIQDTARSPYNVIDARIFSEESSAELINGNGLVDYLSNGFKPRVNHVGINGSNNTMIYAAFAENPFKNSLAR